MAYKTKELLELALKAIDEKKLIFVEEISAFIGIDKTTFYAHHLHESNEIKTAVLNNKINIKQAMRSKWYKSDNATLQMGLMKLIGTEDECHRLNGSRQEIKSEIIDHTKILEDLEKDDDQDGA